MSDLTKAFIAARKEISNPHFDSANPHFKSKFASLKAVIDATIPVLLEHGIAVHQDLQQADGGMNCVTHLYHESGAVLTFGPLFIPFTKNDAQGYASASTYARRYHLMAVMGVVGDADDDGNAASAPAFKSKQTKTKIRNAMLSAAQEADQDALAKATEGLDNDQRADLWDSFNHDQRRMITECRKAEDKAA